MAFKRRRLADALCHDSDEEFDEEPAAIAPSGSDEEPAARLTEDDDQDCETEAQPCLKSPPQPKEEKPERMDQSGQQDSSRAEGDDREKSKKVAKRKLDDCETDDQERGISSEEGLVAFPQRKDPSKPSAFFKEVEERGQPYNQGTERQTLSQTESDESVRSELHNRAQVPQHRAIAVAKLKPTNEASQKKALEGHEFKKRKTEKGCSSSRGRGLSEQARFDDLPDELVVKIFTNLSTKDLLTNIARVSKNLST